MVCPAILIRLFGVKQLLPCSLMMINFHSTGYDAHQPRGIYDATTTDDLSGIETGIGSNEI